MTNFLVMPSVALLLHSCFFLCSVFKVQLRVYTLKIKQCKLVLTNDLAAAYASAKLSLIHLVTTFGELCLASLGIIGGFYQKQKV